MKNRYFIQDISRKNIIKLRRNSSLDSTKSSLRVKKIKLHNEYTPFIKITQNLNLKNVLDFPICMSLFTNNYSLSEKDKKIKNNSGNNSKLNLPKLKNNITNQRKQNELLLPNTKRIMSRNINKPFINSFSPINSTVKSEILNNNKFSIQSVKNIGKHANNKINYSPLINLTNRTDNRIKVMKKFNFNHNNYSLSHSTLKQDITAIKNLKNSSFGNINYNINMKDNKNMKLPLNFFTLKDKGSQKNIILYPIKKVYFNEVNKIEENNNIEEEDNKINQSYIIKNNGNKKFIEFSKLKENNKRNDKISNIVNNQNNKKNNSIDNKINIINKKKNFNTKKLVEKKINESNEDSNKNNKFDSKKKVRNFNRCLTKKKTISIEKAIKEGNKDKINEKYSLNFIFEKEKLVKIKEANFYLTINNKKTNEIYSNNYFLNDFNKIINEKSINNSINTKIFLKKTEMLINKKESIRNIISKQEGKLKQIETSPFSEATKIKMMSNYFKDIYYNINKTEQYKKNILSLKNITITFKFKYFLCYNLRNYIISSTEFGEISFLNTSSNSKNNKIREEIKNNLKSDIDLKNAQNTDFSNKAISINNDIDDTFILKKTKNYLRKDLKLKQNLKNVISINNYILKSFPFYKERNIRKIDLKYSNKNKNNNSKTNFNKKGYYRHISRRLSSINNFVLNNTKLLKKKNSANMNQNLIENKLGRNGKILSRRSAKLFKLDDFSKNFKKQLSEKSPNFNIENYSVLGKKIFFKKIIKDKAKGSKKSLKDSKDNNENNLNEKENEFDNEDQINYEKIYIQLIKYAMEGKHKSFEKYFEENKLLIDINQELYEGNTLLIFCAKEGNFHITKFLCENDAEVNIQNNSGNTALHYAIGKQFYPIADILTRHGAREDIKNLKGLTPWDCIEHNIE